MCGEGLAPHQQARGEVGVALPTHARDPERPTQKTVPAILLTPPAVVAGILGLGGQRMPYTDDLLLPRLQPPDLRGCECLMAHTLLHQAQECTHTLVLQPHTHQQLSANFAHDPGELGREVILCDGAAVVWLQGGRSWGILLLQLLLLPAQGTHGRGIGGGEGGGSGGGGGSGDGGEG